jgi:quercetin dioxygenase-like cupin family protein
MSPVRHRVSGTTLVFSLEKEIQTVREELASVSARIARTLVKDGPLRVTLVGVRPGGGLSEHTSAGPITIHVLEGSITLTAQENTWALTAGSLLALDAAVPHAVHSESGGMFLLTVVGRGGAEPQSG